ncbi:hypothetical protein EYF80_005505 [Liparis tanakae]|uniref:Uncharacterized protein n=1 Tax=Liparis tanakae TaxID=230148 RepID=A0A4Z2J3A1_9TELE|nr:hypothetical protein EYF80_005505 [Liparis tanakae]
MTVQAQTGTQGNSGNSHRRELKNISGQLHGQQNERDEGEDPAETRTLCNRLDKNKNTGGCSEATALMNKLKEKKHSSHRPNQLRLVANSPAFQEGLHLHCAPVPSVGGEWSG